LVLIIENIASQNEVLKNLTVTQQIKKFSTVLKLQ